MQNKRLNFSASAFLTTLLVTMVVSFCTPQIPPGNERVNSETIPQSGSTAEGTKTDQAANSKSDLMSSTRLELVSQGVTYQLVDHWVYSSQNGLTADGKWFDKYAVQMDSSLKDELAEAKEIPFADDITFMKVEPSGTTEVENLSVNIFDKELNIIQRNLDQLDIPSEAGLYYVAVFYSWGDKDTIGYQYIFKTRRQ